MSAELFGRAAAVVGVHGAGLSNIMFTAAAAAATAASHSTTHASSTLSDQSATGAVTASAHCTAANGTNRTNGLNGTNRTSAPVASHWTIDASSASRSQSASVPAVAASVALAPSPLSCKVVEIVPGASSFHSEYVMLAGALGLEHHAYVVPGVGWGDDVEVPSPRHLAAVVRAALLPEEVAGAAAGGRHELLFNALHGGRSGDDKEDTDFIDAQPFALASKCV
mmetsp:Transcript_42111/g.67679  ORF Transcript_42111/g.67679 Transcript_42111/m.67679 type:complete len:224 (+) Transcript_42111:452-1123(+)